MAIKGHDKAVCRTARTADKGNRNTRKGSRHGEAGSVDDRADAPRSWGISSTRRSRCTAFRDAPDREAFLRDVGPRIRGIAAGSGHRRADSAFFDKLPNLEIVSSFGVGYDHVDAAEAARRGIIVTNTPDVLNDEVADLALGLLLATVRKLPQADRFLRDGHWLKGSFPLSATLRERKVGILGLGRIGKAIAKRVEAFGVPVPYHGRTQQEDVAYPYYPTLVGLGEAVDVLIVITPGGAATQPPRQRGSAEGAGVEWRADQRRPRQRRRRAR